MLFRPVASRSNRTSPYHPLTKKGLPCFSADAGQRPVLERGRRVFTFVKGGRSMPLSLSLYLYRLLQEKALRNFEKDNKILSQPEIDSLIKGSDLSGAMKIFRSAVVDHKPVAGVPYYLKAPLEPLFYHDNFKRCIIAGAAGGCAGRLGPAGKADALAVLDELGGPASAGYVQIFARHALGQWVKADETLYPERKGSLLEAFGSTVASLLSAMVFIDHLQATPYAKDVPGLLAEGRGRVRYQMQKVLFSYYVKERGLEALAFADKNITSFLGNFRHTGAGQHYFEEGARSIGFIPLRQKGGLVSGTQQADIGRRLKRICGPYLYALGLFMKECW